jgi:spore germination cell wall hydrolase CwlJ-like protein
MITAHLNGSSRLAAPLLSLALAMSGLAGCAATKPVEEVSSKAVDLKVSDTEFQCLREAVYFEAGLTKDGGRAVADVILNRAADHRFPNSICGVVSQGEGSGRGCQFSYRCDGRADVLAEPRKRQFAEQAARDALQRTADTTNGALYFHSARIAPGWFGTLRRTTTAGGNIFYKP